MFLFENPAFLPQNRKVTWKDGGVVVSTEIFTALSSFNRMECFAQKPDALSFSPSLLVEWIAAVSLAAGAAAVGYLAYKKFLSKDKCCKAMVNLHIQKDNPKVVHAFDMEDLGDKAVYCRCWRSKKVREEKIAQFCRRACIFQ